MIMWAVAGIAVNRVPDVYKHPHTAQYFSMYIPGNRFSKKKGTQTPDTSSRGKKKKRGH